MKRKLILLNIVLAALAAVICWKAWGEWQSSQRVVAQVNQIKVPSANVAPPAQPAPPAPVSPAQYSEIAQKTLFSKDRNPTVVVEVPAAPKPVMPKLPILQGVMGLPSGEVAVLSANPKTPPIGVHEGDKIGDFKLTKLTADEISFEWNGETVTKSVFEMIHHGEAEMAEAAAAPPSPQAAPTPASTAPQPSGNTAGKPGADTGREGTKACAPGDASAAGTVADGYRKVLYATPFGNSCYWEAVK